MQQAGRHQRTPGGLLMPMRATLKGRVRWQVLDERGLPEVPRSPSGFALAPAEGVEQPNLITDLGLDQIAAFDCFGTNPGSSGTWRRYLAVGTGSTTPANGDTTLAAEVQRAASSGSFSNGSTAYALDDTNDVWRAESLVTRLVTMNADRNLTEFGLSPLSTDNIVIRELLRDGVGNPITVSLLNGKSLRIDHTLVVELAAPEAGHAGTLDIEKYDAGNNLEGSTEYTITHGGTVYSNEYGVLFAVWNPYGGSGFVGTRIITSGKTYARLGDPYGLSSTNLATPAWESYQSGSHQRVKRATVPTGSGNADWYGIHFAGGVNTGSPNNFRTGYAVLFETPAFYTKVNTDTMRVGLISTWARA